MSKKIEDSELQTLTLSPTNTNDDENSPFINPASDETAFPISPPPSYSTVTTSSSTLTGDRRKLERMASAPGSTSNTTKPIPVLRVSTPPGGSSRVFYTNERANERKIDLSKISRDRPTPSNSISQKKDAPCCPDTPQPPSLALSSGADKPGSRSQTPESKTGGSGAASSTANKPQEPIASGKTKSILSSSIRTPGEVFTTPSSRGIHLPAPPSRTFPSSGSRARLGGAQWGLRIRGLQTPRQMDRPLQHHTFHADVADVRQIEQGLLQLMEDFQAGNLRAFGKDSRLRQMEAIREQQERLAKLHFDVGAEQDLYPPLSEDGLRASHENMRTLMEKLAQLSESIERLHTNTSGDRRSCLSGIERKISASAQPSIHQLPPHNHHHHHHHHHHHSRHHHLRNESSNTPHHNHHHQRTKVETATPHHHNNHPIDAIPPHHPHNSYFHTPTTTATTSTPPHHHHNTHVATTTTTTTTTQHASPGNPRPQIQGRLKTTTTTTTTTTGAQSKHGKVAES